jgi:hypothetical protein
MNDDDIILKTAGERQIVRQSQAIKRLGRQVFFDLLAAGWLAPCAVKRGPIRPKASIFYDLRDIETAESRVLLGEYPPKQLKKENKQIE